MKLYLVTYTPKKEVELPNWIGAIDQIKKCSDRWFKSSDTMWFIATEKRSDDLYHELSAPNCFECFFIAEIVPGTINAWTSNAFWNWLGMIGCQSAEEHTAESEPEEPSKDDSVVPETMEACIKATPEQCQACDSNEDCPRSCADIENKDAPETECDEHPIEDSPMWMRPMEKIAKTLENLGVKFTREGDDEIHYLRFKRDGKQFTVYFEKQSDGRYKAVLSDLDDKGGQLLWEGIVTGSLGLIVLERKIAELAKGW